MLPWQSSADVRDLLLSTPLHDQRGDNSFAAGVDGGCCSGGGSGSGGPCNDCEQPAPLPPLFAALTGAATPAAADPCAALPKVSGGDAFLASANTPLVGIYFGAKWCPPCRRFSPLLSRFAQHNAKHFSVVFCSVDHSRDQCLSFSRGKHFLCVPFDVPQRRQLVKALRISSFPTLIVFDTRDASRPPKVVTRWGRLAIQGESHPGQLVQSWLHGDSGVLPPKVKLLLLPVCATLLFVWLFWRV